MERKLALCVLGLCSLSSGCALVANTARNICAEMRDTTEEMFERIRERRAVAAARGAARECGAVQVGSPICGSEGKMGVIVGTPGLNETPPVHQPIPLAYLLQTSASASPRPPDSEPPAPEPPLLPTPRKVEPDPLPTPAAKAPEEEALPEGALRAVLAAPQDSRPAEDGSGNERTVTTTTLGQPREAQQPDEGPTLPVP
jgi:hypothetical protein